MKQYRSDYSSQPLTWQIYKTKLPKAVVSQGVSAITGSIQGGIDKYVEGLFSGNKVPLTTAFKSRGLGRGLGGLAPRIITAPIFYHQMGEVRKKGKATPKDYLILTGAGATASGLKGLLEGAIENKGFAKKSLGLLLSRSMSGGASAAYLASRIAKNLHKEDKGPQTLQSKLLHRVALPGVYGAIAGGGKGLWDKVISNAITKQPISKGALPAIAGRAAAGALGGIVLEQLAKWVLKKNKSSRNPNSRV